MATTYNYSVITNFSGSININQLQLEIENDGTIVTNLSHINRADDSVDIVFDAALSTGEETALNNLVSNHVPSTVDPYLHEASGNPATTDDALKGFYKGSYWKDTDNDKAHICLDSAVNSAMWRQITNTKVASHVEVSPLG